MTAPTIGTAVPLYREPEDEATWRRLRGKQNEHKEQA